MELSSDLNPRYNAGKGNIYALWHSSLLPAAYICRKSGGTVMISSSKDGVRAAAVAAKWNYEVIAGSSSKQGFSAFRQCLKALRADKNIVITPDGPRGPREVVKHGVAHLAVLASAPVIPLSVHPSHYWRLKSWDRMIIPKPFSKVIVKTGTIITPDSTDKSEEAIELFRIRIEENLHAISLA